MPVLHFSQFLSQFEKNSLEFLQFARRQLQKVTFFLISYFENMSTSGKSMEYGKSKAAGKGTVVAVRDAIGEEDRSNKYIREADGSWMADEFIPHLNLIEDRLKRVPVGAVGGAYSIEAPKEDYRLSHFGKKEDRFFMVPAQSILSDGLRFPLPDFFAGVLRELGIAPGQQTPHSWRIMTVLYIQCQEKNRPNLLNVGAFLRCYYLQTSKSSGQYYLCPLVKVFDL